MASELHVVVLGRFPPPVDGQSLATERLSSLLAGAVGLDRINLSSAPSEFVESSVRLRTGRVGHYLRQRRIVRSALRDTSESVVFWTAISPSVLGHWRDYATIVSAFRREHRVFGVVHWGNFDRLFRQVLTRRTGTRLLQKIDGLVFLDERLSSKCARWIPSNKRLAIPNTIDEEVLLSDDDLRQKRNLKRERRTTRLLFLSNMTPSKGYMDVLRAVALLRDRVPDMQADFVGRWESERHAQEFLDFVSRNDLAQIVHHHGGVSDRQRIRKFYFDADIFLLPTYYPTEAQPITIIEALNAGTPVVATRHAGIPLMVDDDVEGAFVGARNPDSIAAAVESLVPFERWLAASEAARTRFDRQFHPDRVRRLWLDLIGTANRNVE